MKYNAAGGQRRSKTVKMHIPTNSGFSVMMLELLKYKKQEGAEFAIELLNKCKSEYKFIRSLIES